MTSVTYNEEKTLAKKTILLNWKIKQNYILKDILFRASVQRRLHIRSSMVVYVPVPHSIRWMIYIRNTKINKMSAACSI